MSFDWRDFLDRHGIEYSTRESRDNLHIQCPFCGDADQGHHLGISLCGRGWNCWRSAEHRGRAPQRLIQALLGCGWGEAARIAGKAASGLAGGDAALSGALAALADPEEIVPPANRLKFPKEFGPASESALATAYLEARGYSHREALDLCETFNLQWAYMGDWRYRISIPVYDERGRLLTWTSRAVSPRASIRYKTLTTHPEKAEGGGLALAPITDCFLGLQDLIYGGRFLVITEGPFDAMRLSPAVRAYDGQATCLFGKAISDAQVGALARLRDLYDAVYLLLDPDAAFDTMRLMNKLAALSVTAVFLDGDNDPDEMSDSELAALFLQIGIVMT